MQIDKILFITLSNIGDVVLSLPVLDALRQDFSNAKITVICSERAKDIFQDNPAVKQLIVYQKRSSLKENLSLFKKLKAENFDLVLDLRNTLFGVLLPAKYKSPLFSKEPKLSLHMKDRHLLKLVSLRHKGRFSIDAPRDSLCTGKADELFVENAFKENNIKEDEQIIVISPGARSHTKRWPADKFARLAEALSNEFVFKIFLVGDKEDASICKTIAAESSAKLIDLSGKTSLKQLAALLKKAALVITNDSAVLHIASYLNRPTLAIFGPTNEEKYAPWSKASVVVKRDIFCRPCEKAQCRFGTLKCLKLIKTEDVFSAAKQLLAPHHPSLISHPRIFKRILIERLDRMGDVLLSTPVIKALRKSYPNAYIAMMVSPYTKDILIGNPYLDEIIVYDKDAAQKSWLNSMRFALQLKKKKFDLALILHPINRAHLITFFAGIPRRVGFNKKMGFLLTDKLKHTKQLGEKHEMEYSLDLIRYLGIEPVEKDLFMPIQPESEKWVEDLFKQEHILKHDKLLAVHPAASCPSRIWPVERFAELADRMIEKYGFKIFIISGKEHRHVKISQDMQVRMRGSAINLAGKTSLSQLASLLKRCTLYISSDTGPMHLAVSLGIPVIVLFGRKQKGLSPKRWGPLSKKSRVIHKDVGCIECLAHNCVRGFACFKAITVDEVLEAADGLLKEAKV